MAVNLRRGSAGCVVLDTDSQMGQGTSVIEEGLRQTGAEARIHRVILDRHHEGLAGDLGE